MTSKYELSISTNYVPSWGLVEAFRELFQNALDNEIEDSNNKMFWEYNKESKKIIVANKTSKLGVESLLLGCTTKAYKNDLIGQHGEGYKIAFMVLLRNNKNIKVYNYGAREIWTVRLVKSRRYNNELIPTVFVEKQAFFKTVPNNDLIIEVSDITEDEYSELIEKNLNLRESYKLLKVENKGEILLDSSEVAKVYVKGLYINDMKGLRYGYNFEPNVIKLDRDRRLLNTFDVSWETSLMWKKAVDYYRDNKELSDKALELINSNSLDTSQIHNMSSYNSINNLVAEKFIQENGSNAVPVVNNDEYKLAEMTGKLKPVIVSEREKNIIKNSSLMSRTYEELKEIKTIHEQLLNIVEQIEDKLGEDTCNTIEKELEQLKLLIQSLED